MKRNNILFITTANLSTNPRLLKEVLYLKKQGFDCELLAFELGNQYDDNDRKIIADQQLDVQYISASRWPLIPWLKSTLVQMWSKSRWNGKSSLQQSAFASNKRSYLLKKKLKSCSTTYDLVIAHNLGSLFPAYQFSAKHKIPLGFDMEDFHPGESIDLDIENEQNRRIKLLEYILPRCAYVSFASPLIQKETNKLVSLCKSKQLLVNNAFFEEEFIPPKEIEDELIHFVWFSQYISFGRGLELFLHAADAISNKLHLTLIGSIDDEFHQKELAHRNFASIKKPMHQRELHQQLSNFDVGLALELSTADFNRNICLTNKIFAYAQAGLYILATDTDAQTQFLKNHSKHGALTAQNVTSIRSNIENVIENKKVLRQYRNDRFIEAKKIAFNYEAENLLGMIKAIIQ